MCKSEISPEMGEHYIKTYDRLGSTYFGKMNDQELKRWHSDEKIREIKIESVKCKLKSYKTGITLYKAGITLYKTLNEISGGKNII